MASRRSVIVLGSSNTDLVIRLARLPSPGETLLGKNLTESGGGKGANQAVAAQRAGAPVRFIGAFGNDVRGADRRSELSRLGIDLSQSQTKVGVASGAAFILVGDDGTNIIAVAPGANSELTPADVSDLPDEIFESGNLFVSQLETPLDTVWSALNRARANGMMTILNPAPAQLSIGTKRWLELVDFFVLNESELDALAGEGSGTSLDSSLDRLHGAGARTIILTLGAEGHIVSDVSGKRSHTPTITVNAIDTVAAGDTFVGTLAARLLEDVPLSQAASWASAAATLACTRVGAIDSIPSREEVEAFIGKHRRPSS